jgi:hypothetical protein
MKKEATSAKFLDADNQYPRIQLVTVEQLLKDGERAIRLPPRFDIAATGQEARRAARPPKPPRPPEERRVSPEMLLPLRGGRSATKRGQYLIDLPDAEQQSVNEAAGNGDRQATKSMPRRRRSRS